MTGAEFKALRQSTGLTQQQLADQARVSVSLIRKLECGTADIGNIAARNLIAISAALDVDPRTLIEKAED